MSVDNGGSSVDTSRACCGHLRSRFGVVPDGPRIRGSASSRSGSRTGSFDIAEWGYSADRNSAGARSSNAHARCWRSRSTPSAPFATQARASRRMVPMVSNVNASTARAHSMNAPLPQNSHPIANPHSAMSNEPFNCRTWKRPTASSQPSGTTPNRLSARTHARGVSTR